VRIAAVGRAFPPHVHTQAEVSALLGSLWGDEPRLRERIAGVHAHAGVETRHFARPLEEYLEPSTFGERNGVWLETALELGQRAVLDALVPLGLGPGDVDAFFSTTITGIACPALDVRLMNRLAFRTDVKRTPLFGLGCVAGAAGIARAADYLRAYPDHVVLLLAVELCSLTFQRDDRSLAQVVATGLFGDGAAAVVLVGERRARALELAGPAVLASRSVFYPGTEDIMGWDVSENGFRILLSPRVPELARERLAPDVRAFLGDLGHEPGDVQRWIGHPGGPKVLSAVSEALELGPDALAASYSVLSRVGNLSSASVLLVLRETLATEPGPGTRGLLFAMGPAFCSELVLLEW